MADIKRTILLTIGKVGIVIAIAFAFLLGLTGTVYLSLRSADVTVPDLSNQNRWAAEDALRSVGLEMRTRATRPRADTPPDVILDQFPRAGEVIKEGQTVAVVVSRAATEDEARSAAEESGESQDNTNARNTNANANQNGNQNRAPRPRNSNNQNTGNLNSSNANRANLNANRNLNLNRNANANRPDNTNANRDANRNANRAGAVNSNRPTNTREGGNRNVNTRNANSGQQRPRIVVTPPTFPTRP